MSEAESSPEEEAGKMAEELDANPDDVVAVEDVDQGAT